jgi:hypothetical protein
VTKDFEWIIACTRSCKNRFQLESCRVLVSLFKIKYAGEKELTGELETAIMEADVFMSVEV